MRILTSLATIVACVMLTSGTAQSEGYRLRPGDVLDVSVWQEPKLNKQIIVAPDGRIAYPLVGHLKAGGMTVEGVEAAIKSGLAKQYTTDIDVTVALIAVTEKMAAAIPTVEKAELPSVYVTGEVSKPGRYEVDEATSVLQAIALSGGLGPFAAGKRIKIRREEGGQESLYEFDYEAFSSGDDMTGNIVLQAGDVVIVPERGLFE